jgi:hypothetical protein
MHRLSPRKYNLREEHLCALEVLADAGLWGCAAATLLAYGFPINMLADLVRDGLATARRETLGIGNRKIRAARVWITEEGQSALEDTIRAQTPDRSLC